MSEETNPNERQATPAEKKADIHVQHLQRVFGRDSGDRSTSQKYVIEMFEKVLKQQVFQQNPRSYEYDPYHAAQREGERSLARAFLTDIAREPVSQVTKPIVTK